MAALDKDAFDRKGEPRVQGERVISIRVRLEAGSRAELDQAFLHVRARFYDAMPRRYVPLLLKRKAKVLLVEEVDA